jgi:glycosyltransferase involved in cell wall biosynthesis
MNVLDLTVVQNTAVRTAAGLKIVHIVRSPIGGIFRHIKDLIEGQSKAGHGVGLICDSSTGGRFEDDIIARLAPFLAFGATRLPMRRSISPSDLAAAGRLLGLLSRIAPDVLHCHGAKGGVYGRLISAWLRRRKPVACIYTPHGGTLHFDERSLEGKVYFHIERALEHLTSALVHVSAFEAEAYRRKIGIPRCPAAVIRNGLRTTEFTPVTPRSDACDLLFLGMLRDLKGVDVFLDAIAVLEKHYGRKLTAHVVGQAEEPERYHARARSLGIGERVTFSEPMPTRDAFAGARMIVVPSRAESMPYVVIEAIAAGVPIIATRVGGIPEIFGPAANELVAPGDSAALASAIDGTIADPQQMADGAMARRNWIRDRFSIEMMRSDTEAIYRQCLLHRHADAA